MQTYKDSTNDEIYIFDDDVTVNLDGTITTSNGDIINVPTTLESYTIPDPSPEEVLSTSKLNKKNEIRKNYIIADLQSVTYSNNTWNGGMESVARLDIAKRIAETNGDTDVTFFDINNDPQILTILEAENVIKAIWDSAINNFTIKQNKMAEIDNAASEAEVDAIVWPA